MKIDAEFVVGLHQNVTAAQGRAAVDQMRAQEALDKARDTFQQAIGGLAVIEAVMGRLNAPETEAGIPNPPMAPNGQPDSAGAPADLIVPGEDIADDQMPENLA